MPRKFLSCSWTAAILLAACAGGAPESEEAPAEERDLTLPAVEPIAAINDAPQEPEPEVEAAPPPRPEPPPVPPPEPEPPPPPPEPEPEPLPAPEPPTLLAGTEIVLTALDTITSGHNEIGDSVRARSSHPLESEDGAVLVPAGAEFLGVIADIAPAETPGGEGRMSLMFTRVLLDGVSYEIEARLDSIGTRMKGRGVTAGDAAKVGAGAAVGALAGRVLGGNRRGTAIGAIAGAAAGVGIAAATRDVDIILDAGAPIRLVLTAPLVVGRLEDQR